MSYMNIDKSIFKAYDIRGIYPDQLNEEGAYAMGRAYATLLKRELGGSPITIAVGSDMRVSSPSLKEQVIKGLVDTGVNVDDIGLVSTPTFYFGVAYFGYLGGLQVSASHNPKEYNGFKLVRKGGVPVSGDTGIMDLYEMIAQESYAPMAEQKGIANVREGVVEAEVEDQIAHADVSKIKPFKVVVDGSNAMGSVDVEALF
jgi:phosphomannomutase